MKDEKRNDLKKIWEIDKIASQPEWVQDAFKKNILQWDKSQLKINISVLSPNPGRNFSGGLGIGGARIIYGHIGDFIDLNSGAVLSPKQFVKRYKNK